MQYLLTYWKVADGTILSEDKLIARVLAGEFVGYAVILENYRNIGARLPFWHPAPKRISYDNWVTGVITAIQSGHSGNARLRKIFLSHKHICLPDLELISRKDSTTKTLAHAIWEALPETNIIILGDQLSLLAPYLLELLKGRFLWYTICRDI